MVWSQGRDELKVHSGSKACAGLGEGCGQGGGGGQ